MKTLIILHGWESAKEKWQKVKENLEEQGIKIVVPDIPGFKPETKLFKSWYLNDYVEWLKRFIQEKKKACPELVEGFFLLGHSFGGRVAIKFTTKYPEKILGLILVGAAGIKKKRLFISKTASLFKKFAFLPGYQFFRKIFYKYILRKTDYLKASGFLKDTIKNVLNEDLTPYLVQIENKTLILWGSKDRITPLSDAKLMAKKIKNSNLEILEKIGHTPHLENPELLAQKVKEFLK